RQAARHLGRPPEALRLITLHLGNGASAAAIAGGRSIDTSMGMTPLEGLVMGTRCGDLDPAIPFYLARECAMTPAAIESLLNRESGLLGLAGSSDMREILARAGQGDEQATLALDLFCYRIRKYIGAYIAVLGGLDAVVFTGGIGEHAAEVRRRVCAGLEVFGIRLDPGRNADPSRHAGRIQAAGAPVALLVIPTDEELEIAIQSEAVIVATPPAGGRPGSAGSPGE
ncbi:MAG TPA: acetate kinase, partial [Sedimenticola sp.]|nr:acetate kinase [Sedimenticola sp.]